MSRLKSDDALVLKDMPLKYHAEKVDLVKDLSKKSRKLWKKDRSKCLIANIRFKNNDAVTLVVEDKDGGCFDWEERTYIIVGEYRYYNVTFSAHMMDFDEEFCIPVSVKGSKFKLNFPVRKEMDLKELNAAVAAGGYSQIEYSTSPLFIFRFLQGKFGEQLARGAEIDAFFKSIKTFIVVSILSVFFSMIVNLVFFVVLLSKIGKLAGGG